MNHLDKEVRAALTRLDDALCLWERNTGRESVLILRGSDGFVHRSVSGKPVPNITNDISDAELCRIIQ